jgi:hypothetical protein
MTAPRMYLRSHGVMKRKSAVTRELHEELTRFIGERLPIRPRLRSGAAPRKAAGQSLTHEAKNPWWTG